LEEGCAPFFDISFPASHLIEQGDTVVAEYVFRATHTGTLTMPDGRVVAPTGTSPEVPCVTISEIRDRKFVSMRDYIDNLPVMTQLGLMPGT
jgi:predicted ester cyclase